MADGSFVRTLPKLPSVRDERVHYAGRACGAAADVEPLIRLRLPNGEITITPDAARVLVEELQAALARLPLLFDERMAIDAPPVDPAAVLARSNAAIAAEHLAWVKDFVTRHSPSAP